MHIENLKRGDWILITQFKNLELDNYGSHQEHAAVPLRVRAISAPFVIVSKLGESRAMSVDLRLWEVTKAQPELIREWNRNKPDFMAQNEPKAMPMDGRCRVFYCPVCSDGQFEVVSQPGEEPYFQCSMCDSVVVQKANQL